MQNIIIEEPYSFVSPGRWEFPYWMWRWVAPWYLRRSHGIVSSEVRNAGLLKHSLAAGHGVMLVPNHSRPCDPFVLSWLARAVGRPFYTMSSWYLFKQSRLLREILRQVGAFSVHREGMDREALKAATNMLVEARRPLVIFPEGVVSRTNDQLGILQEGTAFIARSAAKQRAKGNPKSKVVAHPVAMKYFFRGDPGKSVLPVLEEIEQRLSWRPQDQLPLVDRIAKLGEALLALKEIEHLGRAQQGGIYMRLMLLIDHLLVPLEKEWLAGRRADSVIERVKLLRIAIVPDMANWKITPAERARRWKHLADCYLAQQLSLYHPDYLRSRPTPERIVETVERFEEDLTDVSRPHPPLHAVIQVGEAIEVPPGRERGGEDPLMSQLDKQLRHMLEKLGEETAAP
jgi:1-acyl-sn-glycerol-3-phosphate acyltransferase